MVEFTPAQATELRKAFDACDPNRDDLIDQEEFYVLLKKLDSDVSREECLLVFDAADADGDGHISFDEFAAWWTG